MPRIKIPTVGGSYKHDSLPFDSQETINLFPERGGAQSKSSALLRRTPGLKLELTLSNGTGGTRGMYEASNGRAFIVRGYTLVEIDADNVETLRGTFSSTYFKDFGRVSMVDDGLYLVIASESSTKMYTLTFSDNTFAILSDTDAPGNTPVVDYSHTYTFGFNPDSAVLGTFRHSDAGDARSWQDADQYNADGSPDRLVSQKAINGQMCLFGSKSHEYWYLTESTVSGDTWARIPGTTRNVGIASAHAVSNIAGNLYWLGASKDGENIVWRAGEGYTPVRISNRAIEGIIAGFASVDDAWSYSFEYEGHFFFCLTFQTGNKTFLYDITENEWVNWAYRNITTGEQGRHRAIAHMFFNRKNYVGDYENGNIYSLDKNTYTDNGDPIVWERYFPHFENLKERVYWYSLQIDILTGSALLNGQGSDPKIQLRWSDDGGRTFGNWIQMSPGSRGEYYTRVVEYMLGDSRDRVYHLRSSEPIPISIQDKTIAEVEAGAY